MKWPAQKTLVTFFITMSLQAASFAYDLVPFSAQYHFQINRSLSGSASRALTSTGPKQWRYEFKAKASIGSAQEISEFGESDTQIIPKSYYHERSILFFKKKLNVLFNWNKLQVTSRENKEDPITFAIKEKVLDKLSLELQIRKDLMDNGKLKPFYRVITSDDIREDIFQIEGEEVLNTALGNISTLRIISVHKSNTRQTTFWLAKQYDYLPVKVVQKDDSDVYKLEITDLQGLNKSSTK